MDLGSKLMSDVTIFLKYAKYLPSLQRRETFGECVSRSEAMDMDRFPKLTDTIHAAYNDTRSLLAMPSMRKLQFAGDAILKNHARSYNCAFTHLKEPKAFSESLFLLLSGTGVGYSCQRRHVSQLPRVRGPEGFMPYEIPDTIEGWAMALEALLAAYFYGRPFPMFDFGKIRPKNSYLVTTGARAPGPEPLKKMLDQVIALMEAARGRKLTSLEAHDLMCIMSDCVVSGGVRRSAMISLFDRDDQEMLTCKHGEWWIKHPYRARSNNSAVLHRTETTYEEFMRVYFACRDSRAGEPGFFWTSDYDWGTNPCAEIALQREQFCNLSSINMTQVKDAATFAQACRSASVLGTLQAAYTDFHFLSSNWQTTTEAEALLGVSMTGIADSWNTFGFQPSKLMQGVDVIVRTNDEVARILGINPAARTTCIKPEGTLSCVVKSSSGVHDRHGQDYVRNMRILKSDPVYAYLLAVVPDLVSDDQMDPAGAILSCPVSSPAGALLRENTTALDLFERASHMNRFWVRTGHESGANRHNTSVTISVRDEEWDELGQRLWLNRELYSGVSLLPFDGGNYVQAPFEMVSPERFAELQSKVVEIDLTQVIEDTDNTSRTEQSACAGGLCEK